MTLPGRPALAAVLLACRLACGPLLAAEGDPDSTFWSDGKVLFGNSGSYYAHGLVTAPDGRLVVVGTYITPSVEHLWFWKAVGDGAGSTVGTCFFTPPGGATGGHANAAAFGLGGQLLVAGSADYAGDRLAVARFAYPDCTLDGAFDGDGYWTLDVPGGDEYVMAIAVNPFSGKIALGGVWDSGSVRTGVVAVLSDSGVLDAGFSGNGWRNLDPSGTQFDDSVAGITFGEGGRVIVAGTSFYGTDGANADWFVAQVTAAGVLDTGFSGNGLAGVAFDLGGADDDKLYGLARDPNSGALLLTGSVQTDVSEWGLGIARLLPTGALDPAFSGDGRVDFTLGSLTITGSDVAVDGLGRVLIAGNFRDSAGVSDFFVLRYTANGVLDASFGFGGLSVIAFDAGPGDADNDYAEAMTLQGGRVAVAGQVEVDANFNYRIGLARLDVALVFADGFESHWITPWSSAVIGPP